MLGWFLWPRSVSLLDREEAFFAFVIAFIFWVLTEIKESDEVVYQASTLNDIRLARQMTSYASDKFRSILRDHDHSRPIPARFLSEISALLHESEAGTAFFQDKRVQPLFEDFCTVADAYRLHMATYSSPDDMGNQSLHLKDHPYDDDRIRNELDEANRLATRAWSHLPPLIAKIMERIPETFDEPVNYEWFRSTER